MKCNAHGLRNSEMEVTVDLVLNEGSSITESTFQLCLHIAEGQRAQKLLYQASFIRMLMSSIICKKSFLVHEFGGTQTLRPKPGEKFVNIIFLIMLHFILVIYTPLFHYLLITYKQASNITLKLFHCHN